VITAGSATDMVFPAPGMDGTGRLSNNRFLKSDMQKCIRIRNYTRLKCAVKLNMDKFGRNDLRSTIAVKHLIA